MNCKKRIYWILMLLPLVAAVTALFFLPEQIPAHYGMDGQVDRWGSKYEVLLFPVVTIGFGLFMLAMTKVAKKQETQGQNNEAICLLTGMVGLGVFDVMTLYFLYCDFRQVTDLNTPSLDLNQLLFGLMGVGMILIGNVMPKVKPNSVLGLRTSWSMKNDTTWKKSQRFGGISLILAGVLTLLCCLLTKGWACFALSMGILLVVMIVDVVYTYHAAKKWG